MIKMKKFILFFIIVVGVIGFSATFTGNKKYHINEMVGKYHGQYEDIVIQNSKGKLVFSYNDGSKGYFKPVGKGLYVPVYTVNKNYHGYGTMELYFAYDLKLKTLVMVGQGNEIIEAYKKVK
mgnify:CR=1 FL=1